MTFIPVLFLVCQKVFALGENINTPKCTAQYQTERYVRVSNIDEFQEKEFYMCNKDKAGKFVDCKNSLSLGCAIHFEDGITKLSSYSCSSLEAL